MLVHFNYCTHGSAHTQIVTFKQGLCTDRFLYHWPFENSWLDASAWVNDMHIPSQGMVKTDRQSSKFPCIKEEQLAARLNNHLTDLWDFVYFSKIPITHSDMKIRGFCLGFCEFLWGWKLHNLTSLIFSLASLQPGYKLWCKLFIRWTYILIRVGIYVVYQGYPPQMEKIKKKPALTPKTWNSNLEWNFK